jgi:hypothetical protein
VYFGSGAASFECRDLSTDLTARYWLAGRHFPGVHPILYELKRGLYLRRLAPIASACTVLFFVSFAHAQQGDIAVGAGTLLAFKNNTSSEALLPPQQKGGIYPSVSFNLLLRNRLGLNAEISWRDKRSTYDGFESYRPFFTDVNALFQPKLSKKFGLDFTGGIGVETNRFYLPGSASCGAVAGICYVSSDHFMEQLGAGFHYYVWHHFPHLFVRPEIHYYHVQNNFEFHSDNVFRANVSIGYRFGNR